MYYVYQHQINLILMDVTPFMNMETGNSNQNSNNLSDLSLNNYESIKHISLNSQMDGYN